MAVIRAKVLDQIARRYGVLPTDVLEADTELFHIIELADATPQES